jgi:hypothetical protein
LKTHRQMYESEEEDEEKELKPAPAVFWYASFSYPCVHPRMHLYRLSLILWPR